MPEPAALSCRTQAKHTQAARKQISSRHSASADARQCPDQHCAAEPRAYIAQRPQACKHIISKLTRTRAHARVALSCLPQAATRRAARLSTQPDHLAHCPVLGAHDLKSIKTTEGMGSLAEVPAWARSLWCGWGRRGTSTGLWGTPDARHPTKGNRSGVRRARRSEHISAPPERGNCFFDLRIFVPAFYTSGAGQRRHRGLLGSFSGPFLGKRNRIPIIRAIPIIRQVTDTFSIGK